MKKFLLTLLAVVGLHTAAMAGTSTLTLTSKDNLSGLTTSAPKTVTMDDNIGWTFTMMGSGATLQSYDSTKGLQFGSANNPVSSLTIVSGGFFGKTITDVTINTSGASKVDATVSVTVGGTKFQNNNSNSYTLTSSAADAKFTGSASGEVTIAYAVKAKAIYLKSITVTYEDGTDKTLAVLAWSKEEEEITVGSAFTAPTLSVDPEDARGSVVYTAMADPVGLLTVDSKTGEITVDTSLVGWGMVQAKIPNNDPAYTAEAVTYSLTINDIPHLGEITLNGRADAEAEAFVGDKLTFAADNAEELLVIISDEEGNTIVEEMLEASSYEWTVTSSGMFTANVSAAREGDDDKEVTFTITATEKPATFIQRITASTFNLKGNSYSEHSGEIDGIGYSGMVCGTYLSGESTTVPAKYFSIRNSNSNGTYGAIVITANPSKAIARKVTVKQIKEHTTARKFFVHGKSEAYTEGKGLTTSTDSIGEGLGEKDCVSGSDVTLELPDNTFPYIAICSNGALQMEYIEIEFEMPKVTPDTELLTPSLEGVVPVRTDDGLVLTVKHDYMGASLHYKHSSTAQSTRRRATDHGDYLQAAKNDDGEHVITVPGDGILSYYGYHAGSDTKGVVREAEIYDGVPTSISMTVMDTRSVEIYDLQGRRVLNPGRGLYIQNGQKVIR